MEGIDQTCTEDSVTLSSMEAIQSTLRVVQHKAQVTIQIHLHQTSQIPMQDGMLKDGHTNPLHYRLVQRVLQDSLTLSIELWAWITEVTDRFLVCLDMPKDCTLVLYLDIILLQLRTILKWIQVETEDLQDHLMHQTIDNLMEAQDHLETEEAVEAIHPVVTLWLLVAGEDLYISRTSNPFLN